MSRNQDPPGAVGQPHPDYPYEMRQANAHTFYSPDIHGHHVYLRSPSKRSPEWRATAVHPKEGTAKFHLGPDGDAHQHMRHIWDQLDPGHNFSVPETARMQWMFDQALSRGSSRAEEFNEQIRRTRGMN